jgi:hypothetical protein
VAKKKRKTQEFGDDEGEKRATPKLVEKEKPPVAKNIAKNYNNNSNNANSSNNNNSRKASASKSKKNKKNKVAGELAKK